MSLEDRFFCDSGTGLVSTFNECQFKPAATKRAFLVKKGFNIDTASTNLNSLDWWETAIAAGNIVPLPDGTFTDVTQNPQEGNVGTKAIKTDDGETAASYQASLPACLVSQLAILESNNSLYDVFFITSIPQLIGKYDADNDIIYPVVVNSIDLRSKPLANDGTATEGILDTLIIRYNEVQSKNVRYFDLTDAVANVTGLRQVLLEVISNDASTVTVKVVTACEGLAVDDLTETTDIQILDNSGAEIAVSGLTLQSEGVYLLDAVLTPASTYQVGIPTVASNDESFTDGYVEYTAV